MYLGIPAKYEGLPSFENLNETQCRLVSVQDNNDASLFIRCHFRLVVISTLGSEAKEIGLQQQPLMFGDIVRIIHIPSGWILVASNIPVKDMKEDASRASCVFLRDPKALLEGGEDSCASFILKPAYSYRQIGDSINIEKDPLVFESYLFRNKVLSCSSFECDTEKRKINEVYLSDIVPSSFQSPPLSKRLLNKSCAFIWDILTVNKNSSQSNNVNNVSNGSFISLYHWGFRGNLIGRIFDDEEELMSEEESSLASLCQSLLMEQGYQSLRDITQLESSWGRPYIRPHKRIHTNIPQHEVANDCPSPTSIFQIIYSHPVSCTSQINVANKVADKKYVENMQETSQRCHRFKLRHLLSDTMLAVTNSGLLVLKHNATDEEAIFVAKSVDLPHTSFKSESSALYDDNGINSSHPCDIAFGEKFSLFHEHSGMLVCSDTLSPDLKLDDEKIVTDATNSLNSSKYMSNLPSFYDEKDEEEGWFEYHGDVYVFTEQSTSLATHSNIFHCQKIPEYIIHQVLFLQHLMSPILDMTEHLFSSYGSNDNVTVAFKSQRRIKFLASVYTLSEWLEGRRGCDGKLSSMQQDSKKMGWDVNGHVSSYNVAWEYNIGEDLQSDKTDKNRKTDTLSNAKSTSTLTHLDDILKFRRDLIGQSKVLLHLFYYCEIVMKDISFLRSLERDADPGSSRAAEAIATTDIKSNSRGRNPDVKRYIDIYKSCITILKVVSSSIDSHEVNASTILALQHKGMMRILLKMSACGFNVPLETIFIQSRLQSSYEISTEDIGYLVDDLLRRLYHQNFQGATNIIQLFLRILRSLQTKDSVTCCQQILAEILFNSNRLISDDVEGNASTVTQEEGILEEELDVAIPYNDKSYSNQECHSLPSVNLQHQNCLLFSSRCLATSRDSASTKSLVSTWQIRPPMVKLTDKDKREENGGTHYLNDWMDWHDIWLTSHDEGLTLKEVLVHDNHINKEKVNGGEESIEVFRTFLKTSFLLLSEMCRGGNLIVQKKVGMLLPPEMLLSLTKFQYNSHLPCSAQALRALNELILQVYVRHDLVFPLQSAYPHTPENILATGGMDGPSSKPESGLASSLMLIPTLSYEENTKMSPQASTIQNKSAYENIGILFNKCTRLHSYIGSQSSEELRMKFHQYILDEYLSLSFSWTDTPYVIQRKISFVMLLRGLSDCGFLWYSKYRKASKKSNDISIFPASCSDIDPSSCIDPSFSSEIITSKSILLSLTHRLNDFLANEGIHHVEAMIHTSDCPTRNLLKKLVSEVLGLIEQMFHLTQMQVLRGHLLTCNPPSYSATHEPTDHHLIQSNDNRRKQSWNCMHVSERTQELDRLESKRRHEEQNKKRHLIQLEENMRSNCDKQLTHMLLLVPLCFNDSKTLCNQAMNLLLRQHCELDDYLTAISSCIQLVPRVEDEEKSGFLCSFSKGLQKYTTMLLAKHENSPSQFTRVTKQQRELQKKYENDCMEVCRLFFFAIREIFSSDSLPRISPTLQTQTQRTHHKSRDLRKDKHHTLSENTPRGCWDFYKDLKGSLMQNSLGAIDSNNHKVSTDCKEGVDDVEIPSRKSYLDCIFGIDQMNSCKHILHQVLNFSYSVSKISHGYQRYFQAVVETILNLVLPIASTVAKRQQSKARCEEPIKSSNETEISRRLLGDWEQQKHCSSAELFAMDEGMQCLSLLIMSLTSCHMPLSQTVSSSVGDNAFLFKFVFENCYRCKGCEEMCVALLMGNFKSKARCMLLQATSNPGSSPHKTNQNADALTCSLPIFLLRFFESLCDSFKIGDMRSSLAATRIMTAIVTTHIEACNGLFFSNESHHDHETDEASRHSMDSFVFMIVTFLLTSTHVRDIVTSATFQDHVKNATYSQQDCGEEGKDSNDSLHTTSLPALNIALYRALGISLQYIEIRLIYNQQRSETNIQHDSQILDVMSMQGCLDVMKSASVPLLVKASALRLYHHRWHHMHTSSSSQDASISVNISDTLSKLRDCLTSSNALDTKSEVPSLYDDYPWMWRYLEHSSIREYVHIATEFLFSVCKGERFHHISTHATVTTSEPQMNSKNVPSNTSMQSFNHPKSHEASIMLLEHLISTFSIKGQGHHKSEHWFTHLLSRHSRNDGNDDSVGHRLSSQCHNLAFNLFNHEASDRVYATESEDSSKDEITAQVDIEFRSTNRDQGMGDEYPHVMKDAFPTNATSLVNDVDKDIALQAYYVHRTAIITLSHLITQICTCNSLHGNKGTISDDRNEFECRCHLDTICSSFRDEEALVYKLTCSFVGIDALIRDTHKQYPIEGNNETHGGPYSYNDPQLQEAVHTFYHFITRRLRGAMQDKQLSSITCSNSLQSITSAAATSVLHVWRKINLNVETTSQAYSHHGIKKETHSKDLDNVIVGRGSSFILHSSLLPSLLPKLHSTLHTSPFISNHMMKHHLHQVNPCYNLLIVVSDIIRRYSITWLSQDLSITSSTTPGMRQHPLPQSNIQHFQYHGKTTSSNMNTNFLYSLVSFLTHYRHIVIDHRVLLLILRATCGYLSNHITHLARLRFEGKPLNDLLSIMLLDH